MKFAPVCPIHIYEALAEQGQKFIGDYFLLLAHDVLANEDRYRKFFVDNEEVFGDGKPFIIMDNSVIELGKSVSTDTLIKAVNIVDADVLVIPDALQDGVETYNLAARFISEWVASGNEIEQNCELMFVPQGNHQTQYENCVTEAAKNLMDHIGWIGVARNVTNRIYQSRILAIDFIRNAMPEVKIHMLGFSDHTMDDMSTCFQCKTDLMGIDSAVPLRIEEPMKFPIQDAGKRGNWWNEVQPSEQLFDNVLDMRSRLGEIEAE